MAIVLDLTPYVELSDDQFFELCQRHNQLRMERTARGELVILSPTGGDTGSRNASLTAQLFTWSRSRNAGPVFDSNTGFKLPNGAERSPDGSWVSRSRWEALSLEQRRRFPPLCPDLVVELLSPSDRKSEAEAKMQEYLECGARLGWLLDPQAGEVQVYRPGQPIERLDHPLELSGGEVAEGLILDLDGIL